MKADSEFSQIFSSDRIVAVKTHVEDKLSLEERRKLYPTWKPHYTPPVVAKHWQKQWALRALVQSPIKHESKSALRAADKHLKSTANVFSDLKPELLDIPPELIEEYPELEFHKYRLTKKQILAIRDTKARVPKTRKEGEKNYLNWYYPWLTNYFPSDHQYGHVSQEFLQGVMPWYNAKAIVNNIMFFIYRRYENSQEFNSVFNKAQKRGRGTLKLYRLDPACITPAQRIAPLALAHIKGLITDQRAPP